MNLRTLPSQPSVSTFRREARRRLNRCAEGDPDALAALHDAIGEIEAPKLAHVYLAIAREHGFKSWPRFLRHVERRGAVVRAPADRVVAAVQNGDLATLEAILAEHPSTLTHRTDEGYSLLHHAASSTTRHHLQAGDVAHRLINGGLAVDVRVEDGSDGEGATPLHFAASLGHMAVLEVLLERGAQVELETLGSGGTALVQALFYGEQEAAQRLARISVAPDNLRVAAGLGQIERVRSWFTSQGRLRDGAGRARTFYRPHDEMPTAVITDDPQEILGEAFAYAVRNGHLAVGEVLLEHGAPIDFIPVSGTALHEAAVYGAGNRVEWLLSRGARTSIEDRQYGSMPYSWAHFGGHGELAARLLRLAAEEDVVAAVVLGDRDLIEQRLAEGPAEDRLASALGAALDAGDAELARALEKAGGSHPDVRYAIRYGAVGDGDELLTSAYEMELAVDAAVDAGRMDQIEHLVERGAELSLLHYCALGRLDDVMRLVEGGADIERAGVDGARPLHRAIRNGHADVVLYLLDEGADPSANADEETFGARALHLAAAVGASNEVIDALIAHGGDLNCDTNVGTPLDCAERDGRGSTAAYMKDLGALGRFELGTSG